MCVFVSSRACALLFFVGLAQGRKCQSYRMVLPVRRRIHWGMGRFWFFALASFCFVRKDLWLCHRGQRENLRLLAFHLNQLAAASWRRRRPNADGGEIVVDDVQSCLA